MRRYNFLDSDFCYNVDENTLKPSSIESDDSISTGRHVLDNKRLVCTVLTPLEVSFRTVYSQLDVFVFQSNTLDLYITCNNELIKLASLYKDAQFTSRKGLKLLGVSKEFQGQYVLMFRLTAMWLDCTFALIVDEKSLYPEKVCKAPTNQMTVCRGFKSVNPSFFYNTNDVFYILKKDSNYRVLDPRDMSIENIDKDTLDRYVIGGLNIQYLNKLSSGYFFNKELTFTNTRKRDDSHTMTIKNKSKHKLVIKSNDEVVEINGVPLISMRFSNITSISQYEDYYKVVLNDVVIFLFDKCDLSLYCFKVVIDTLFDMSSGLWSGNRNILEKAQKGRLLL